MRGWSLGAPAAWLRPFVSRYVGYRQDGVPPGVHRGLPSRHLTIVVGIDEPVELVAMPDRRQSPGTFDVVVGGLHLAPALVRRRVQEAGIHIDVTPLGARALFGMPAAEVASLVVDGREVIGGHAVELRERVTKASSWAARFAVVDEVLAGLLHDGRAPRPEVAWAWDRLVAEGGLVEVGDLASRVGWSRRHFSEQFCTEVGLPPKVAARVVRFDRARRMLERPDRPGLAVVAAACGYYDQAHLTREWRELAGCTPRQWMAAELPFVQDEPAVASAS